MPIDFTRALKNLDGTTAKEGNDDLTLGDVAVRALCGVLQTDKAVESEENVKRFFLAEHIHRNGKAEVSAEQLALLKERISRAFLNPLVAGQAIAMLDPDGAAKFAYPKAKIEKAA